MQKTAYEMRISDWSSDVCSSDLGAGSDRDRGDDRARHVAVAPCRMEGNADRARRRKSAGGDGRSPRHPAAGRSDEHTSELQSLMRISYAVFCLKKKKQTRKTS